MIGSGEVDLDVLLEDFCIMEKDMNFGSEIELVFLEIIVSLKMNFFISFNMKVCCKFSFLVIDIVFV